MATRAFILIETQVGRAKQVALGLRALEGVISADVITGPFDIIALIEASDMSAMADLNQYQGGMCIAGVLTTTERTPRHFILPLGPN